MIAGTKHFDREVAAYRIAGSVFAAYKLGRDLGEVSIVFGRFNQSRPAENPLEVTIWLSGWYAAAWLKGKELPNEDDNFGDLRDWLREYRESNLVGSLNLEDLMWRAQILIDGPSEWTAVQTVATELLDNKGFSSRSMKRLISQTMATHDILDPSQRQIAEAINACTRKINIHAIPKKGSSPTDTRSEIDDPRDLLSPRGLQLYYAVQNLLDTVQAVLRVPTPLTESYVGFLKEASQWLEWLIAQTEDRAEFDRKRPIARQLRMEVLARLGADEAP